MKKKVVLNLTPRARDNREHPRDQNSCRHHMVVLPGYGDKDFKFPPLQTLVNSALARLEREHGPAARKAKADAEADKESTEDGGDETELHVGPPVRTPKLERIIQRNLKEEIARAV